MKIDEVTLKAINKYKNTLRQIGYCNNSETKKLLMLVFLSELLHDDYSVYITENDYKIINNAITCLSKNSCLIDYFEYAHHVKPIDNYLLDTPIRVSENMDIELSENNVLKLINR